MDNISTDQNDSNAVRNNGRATNVQAIKDAARAYLASGICVLPAKRKAKRPNVSSWREYQTRLPTAEELTQLFAVRSIDGVCVLAGTISGNLEAIDFDSKAIAYDRWADMVGAELVSRLVVQRTQNGGKHVLYRCESAIPGNAKLAEDKVDGKTRTLIETRGEGGLVICAPTDGYEVEQGNLLELPVLTAQERNKLILVAESLGDHPAEVADQQTLRSYGTDTRPGDDYNETGKLNLILEQHGWQRCGQRGENEHWRRPGKSDGTSATFNGKTFYVFSSSTPLDAGKGYSKFQVYATLVHGGDYSAAARQLREDGFGVSHEYNDGWNQGAVEAESTPTVTVVEESGSVDGGQCVLATMNPTRKAPARSSVMALPADLLEVPGFVGEFVQYCRETCFADQPALFLAAGLCLQGALAGRKIRDRWKNRPNIYTLGIAPTGTGKEWPRTVVSGILRAIGAPQLGGLESPKSGNALMRELSEQPARIAMVDEFGKFMNFNKSYGMHWAKEIVDGLLKLFSAGDGTFYGAQYADSTKRIEIDRPSLSLFGTTVGDSLWKNLTLENVTDGLLSRMLIFHGDEFPSRGGRDAEKPLPESLVTHAQNWYDGAFVYPPTSNLRGIGALKYPEKVADITDEALARIEQIMDLPFTTREPTKEGRALASRTAQITCKLALVYACSDSATKPVVTIQGVEWAYRLAEHSRRLLLHIATHEIHADTCEERSEQVLTWLRQVGGESSYSKIGQKFKKWTPKERQEVMQNLQESGLVDGASIVTHGRPGKVYRLTNEAEVNEGDETA